MLQAKPAHSSPLQPKTTAMRRLALLVLLLTISNQAAASGAPTEAVRARSVYEYVSQNQPKALGAKNSNNEKNSRFAGPSNEVEAKRLKLIFLLLMSQGQSRAPGY